MERSTGRHAGRCGADRPGRAPLARWTLALVVALALPRLATPAEPVFDAVIGGTPVDVDRAGESRASVVALIAPGLGAAADRQFCGATVIAPRWLMTAAHCLYGVRGDTLGAADLRAVAGVVDLRAEPVEERVVTNLFVHPGYDHATGDAYDDIALIELANELDAPAVSLFDGDIEALGAASGTIVGWGAIEFVDPRRATYPDALHHARVPLVSRATCNHPASYDGYVGEGQFCAGFAEGGVDTCTGDSGGPLFVDTGERVEQVGVVSYGRDCAVPLFYGIYTSVSAYHDWVTSYVEPPPPSGGSGGGASGVSWLLALVGCGVARRRRTSGARPTSTIRRAGSDE